MDRKRWNLAHGRVTVSTVGLVSQMRKLSKDLPHVNLALSLHAPNQEMRVKIVPSAARYPIEDLIDALDGHMRAYLSSTERLEHSNRNRGRKKSTTVSHDENEPQNGETTGRLNFIVATDGIPSARRRAMVEYVMLEGETSTVESAHELGKLCQGKNLVVNLIPYNATNVKDQLKCPSWGDMMKFRDILSSYKVFCTIRRTMGSDIDSACGQLITLQRRDAGGGADIEGSASSCGRSQSASKRCSTNRATHSKGKKKKTDDYDNRFGKYMAPLIAATGIVALTLVVSVAMRHRKR